MEFTVRRVTEDDWEKYRDIRLEMLADTPIAYLETLDDALQRDEDGWRERAATRGANPSIRIAAITSDGTWIGSMGGFIEEGVPVLVGVYVAAPYRGDAFGVTSALMQTIEDWAAEYSPAIRLDVHESNARAKASYLKRGYVETGRTQPYPPDPEFLELEMVKQLR
ncbi:MAG TPA: GNAT family N-acetyltransferase [Galbitalea sp.]|jgi:GNAT superfamily N-acetyltransferase|nr:GNAT family N-acetyltransferase [Galbitalea sp.]